MMRRADNRFLARESVILTEKLRVGRPFKATRFLSPHWISGDGGWWGERENACSMYR